MVKLISATATASVFIFAMCDSANALSFRNIGGRWCTSASTITFSPSQIVWASRQGGPTITYKVAGYAYGDQTIRVTYQAAGGALRSIDHTEFGKGTMLIGTARTQAQRC